MVLITHSDGLSAENVFTALNEAEVPCAVDDTGKPVHFMFNNRQSDGYNEDDKAKYGEVWNFGCEGI